MKKIKTLSSKNQVICCLRDKVADTFGAPSTFINEPVAKRSFIDLMQSDMYKSHKGDYELIFIGEYDVENGVLIPCDHKIIFRGDDVVE